MAVNHIGEVVTPMVPPIAEGHPAFSPIRADLADAVQSPHMTTERVAQANEKLTANLPPHLASQMQRVVSTAVRLSSES